MISLYDRGATEAQGIQGLQVKQLVPDGAGLDQSPLCKQCFCARHCGRYRDVCRWHRSLEGDANGQPWMGKKAEPSLSNSQPAVLSIPVLAVVRETPDR